MTENETVKTYCSFCGVGTDGNPDDDRPLCEDHRED